ncbi:MAG: hypothetical protein QOF98_1094 [Streptomyces sp.]|nr:hypothetical protein [Streptomyces sp.]
MDQLRAEDPSWIGAYRLLGRLGTGGMGRVYLARSERGRTVAVKLVRAELAAQEEFRSRFRREVLAARRVGGAWTAPVLDADTEAEVPWVATGYVAGPSLHQVVAKDYGPLPERSVRVLASGLLHALADIHGAGLIHRDLKPSNVMVTLDGPRVIDFGIARALETVTDDGQLTTTGAMLGSPAFMSPEQVRGDRVTPACDVFCLGSVLAYAATGLQPFGAAASGVHAQMFRIVQEPPDLAPVPDGLRPLVAACLSKTPEERPTLAEVRILLGPDPGEDEPTARDDEPWLPGAIVAQLGRQVVRLLELESADTGPLPVVPASVVGGSAVGSAEDLAGAPADAEPQPEAVPWQASHSPTYGPAYIPPYAAPPADQAPPDTAATPPARRGRPRALVAVLASLAVIAGVATAYVAVHESGNGGADPAPSASGSGGSATGSADPSGAADGQAPADMVGTWRTTFSSDGGDNVRTLVVHGDGSVELSGEGPDYTCSWSMRVTAAGPPVLLSPSQVTSGQPAGSCSPGETTALTLLDPTHLKRENVTGDRTPLTYEKLG